MMIDGKELTCSGCVYWSRSRKEYASNGQCRRFPPTVERTDGGLKSLWPMTESFGWCGEHAVPVEGVQR